MPPWFTRPTINATVRTMDNWYHSSIEEDVIAVGSVVSTADALLGTWSPTQTRYLRRGEQGRCRGA